MGLLGVLKHTLFWPVTGPQYLIKFSLERVQGVVRDELTDDSSVKAELMELQLLLELGDIDDAEYVRREAELMQRLREIREWRERFGMGVSGGLVRVAQEPAEGETEDKVGGRAAGEGEPTARPGGIASPAGAEIELDFGFPDDEH